MIQHNFKLHNKFKFFFFLIDLGIQSISDTKNLFYQEMSRYSTLDDVTQPINEFIISCEYQGYPCANG